MSCQDHELAGKDLLDSLGEANVDVGELLVLVALVGWAGREQDAHEAHGIQSQTSWTVGPIRMACPAEFW